MFGSITPGDFMRQTIATLRHRGYGVDEVASVKCGIHINLIGDLADLETGEIIAPFAAHYAYDLPNALVVSSEIGLSYTFQPEKS